MVERWFGAITTKRIRRGSFGSVAELIEAIDDYIANHNEDPIPFIWTKTAKQNLSRELGERCDNVGLTYLRPSVEFFT